MQNKCLSDGRRRAPAGDLARNLLIALAAGLSLILAACIPVPQTAAPTSGDDATDPPATIECEATEPDSMGPFYEPNAPFRSQVGSGYVLSGRVLALEGCLPISDALVEFWLASPQGDYGDDYRASLMSDGDGLYEFESHVPVPYAGRPPHIHIRASAPGFQALVTQHYPEEGKKRGEFDLVLVAN